MSCTIQECPDCKRRTLAVAVNSLVCDLLEKPESLPGGTAVVLSDFFAAAQRVLLLAALGWQGGTIHQAIDAVKRLCDPKEIKQLRDAQAKQSEAVLVKCQTCGELIDYIECRKC